MTELYDAAIDPLADSAEKLKKWWKAFKDTHVLPKPQSKREESKRGEMKE